MNNQLYKAHIDYNKLILLYYECNDELDIENYYYI